MAKIMLDKERTLKYTFADILEIRKKYAEKDLSLEQLAEIILVGLKRDDPKLALQKLCESIDMERFPELMSAVRTASGKSVV